MYFFGKMLRKYCKISRGFLPCRIHPELLVWRPGEPDGCPKHHLEIAYKFGAMGVCVPQASSSQEVRDDAFLRCSAWVKYYDKPRRKSNPMTPSAHGPSVQPALTSLPGCGTDFSDMVGTQPDPKPINNCFRTFSHALFFPDSNRWVWQIAPSTLYGLLSIAENKWSRFKNRKW